MSNFIYYEKLEDYEEQVRKAKECDEKDNKIKALHVQIEVLEDIMKYEWDLNYKLDKVINETLNLLKNYENDNEANRYAPIKEAIEILDKENK